ncbi:putative fungal lipase-like domain, P-loop containing nucleoside triphosphate hydrolase [Dioscorea sansibarensis]
MDALRSRVESWIRDQTDRIMAVRLPQPPRWRWSPWKARDDRRERERKLREEYERQRKQLLDLCRAVKADSVADLQEILSCMVLSECVYKRPASEMIRAINKFKSDFGGQIVSLECVQPSLDHVPHRYLLAEAGDTLYASFIGTKQYKDVITDVNILQGAIFHEDDAEDFGLLDVKEDQVDLQNKMEEIHGKPHQVKTKQLKNNLKPAAHRGFLARAKGIPALELYKLAQKKNQKLVLCGHSLGGAVAVLATLAILRVLLLSPLVKDHEKVNIKCITFSQPPVGNAALRDYVHRKGWQHHFKTYCIPEDLVPRILSPAYFHHYNAANWETSPDIEISRISSAKHKGIKQSSTITKENGEQLVLGLGPVQTSFWRLSKLVPLEGIQKNLNLFKRVGKDSRKLSAANNSVESMVVDTDGEPQSLEIQEGSEGISLAPLPDVGRGPGEPSSSQENEKSRVKVGNSTEWRRVPYLPSYVPFGQLYLLGKSSVELLSEAEYSKLTSVRSVIAELRERFQSHSMRSYRSRFQKIFDMCMGLGSLGSSPFLGIEQLPQFPNLQQLLGLAAVDDVVGLGNIVEPPVIQTATSVVPLGWTGVPGNKNAEPLKVDIIGHGLHLCTLVQAQVNGNWCSTAVESLPSMPPYSSQHHMQPDSQKMRILIGAPLKKPPKHSGFDDSLPSVLSSPVTDLVNFNAEQKTSLSEERSANCKGFDVFVVYCTSDFVTVSKEVYVRTRRVRLLGFEGAGKTSLLGALIKQGKPRNEASLENILPELNSQEVVADGISYFDSPGVNLQELHSGVSSFREELQAGANDIHRKTDLIVLVHNLSQRIPWYHQANTPSPQPALSLLLNEARCLGVPWVLAITNKFSVSADQQKTLVDSAMEAYQVSAAMTEVVNSCPFVIPCAPLPWSSVDQESSGKTPAKNNILAPISFARMPFQRKAIIMPVEGVAALRQLIHCVLRNQEDMAFQELADNRLSVELARRRETLVITKQESPEKGNSITAAVVGASLGAGLGVVMAIVMGAASALRKP